MLHDPAVYPEPEVFRPDRFLASDGTFIEDPLVRAAFGFGRRSAQSSISSHTYTHYEILPVA